MTNSRCSQETHPRHLIALLVPLSLLALALPSGFAGSATWKATPANGVWNRAANWDPATVPSNRRDTATFGLSSLRTISLRSPIAVGATVFEAGVDGYTFTVGPGLSLDFMKNGVTNNSDRLQKFFSTTDAAGNLGIISFSRHATAGDLCAFITASGMANGAAGSLTQFNNFAAAGSSTFINNGAAIPGARGGETDFFDNTSAGTGTFTAGPGTAFDTEGGVIAFFGTATAATATVIAQGGDVPEGFGGSIYLRDNSSAADGTFTVEGGSVDSSTGARMYFEDEAYAGAAFITVKGGENPGTSNGATLSFLDSSSAGGSQIFVSAFTEGAQPGVLYFCDDSTGALAILRLFDGILDISPHNPGTVILGNILGYYGTVYLGANNLEIGGNNITGLLEIDFRDGGINGGVGGSITKTGSNDLFLTVESTFTGGITVKKGTLILQSPTGSASGTGPVVVNGATLKGYYTIDGPVTINAGGSLLPNGQSIGFYYGSFETRSTITFASGSSYKWELKTQPTESDLLIANGVTLESGAQFAPLVSGSGKIEAGLELVAISNTSANPIAGTFSGLPQGSVVNLGQNNSAQVSYFGGDGNDFTLTVLP